MSHVVDMKCNVERISAAEKTATALGGKLVKADTYNWYGHSVGDYPLPAGFTKEMLGTCEYKITFDGVGYEVGLAKNPVGKGWTLLMDFWGPGAALLGKMGGPEGLLFKQRYAIEVQKEVAEQEGWTWEETVNEQTSEIELLLTQF